MVVVLSASTLLALTSCRERLGPGADLAGCDLSGFDLTGADLRRSDLSGASLTSATLHRAVLDEANLAEADLTGTSLRGASFRNADLRGAELRSVDLAGVDLQGADLSGAALDGAGLSGALLFGATGLTDEALVRALGVTPDALAATLIEQDIRLEPREAVLATLGPACGGEPVPGAAGYPQGALHPMVILDADGAVASDTDQAPARGWEPTAVRFAQLVACVEEDDPLQVEFCPYQAIGGETGSIVREQHQRAVRVVEAATGQTVFEQTFEGSLPKPCPVTHFFLSADPHETYSGSQVGFAEFEADLAALVE